MRKELCNSLIDCASNKNMIFLTGDLGFMALEKLRGKLKKRFINAGVAEQNMLSISAAMAREGMQTWVYSIAPFLYARPFEQIRNDICFHELPVKLIGNGGGYGYGVMGPTHHAIEDYGTLLTLPKMSVYLPIFNSDIAPIIKKMIHEKGPSYLRLGLDESINSFQCPAYAPWRRIIDGKGGALVIACGTIAGSYIDSFQKIPENKRPEFWVISELPINENTVPNSLVGKIKNCSELIVIEEHVAHGGFASELCLYLMKQKIIIKKFKHYSALKHIFETYGSQKFLRKESLLDPEYICKSFM